MVEFWLILVIHLLIFHEGSYCYEITAYSDSDPEKTEKEVKNAEQDISLAKNYCITVHMQKISSHLKFILKIQQNNPEEISIW